MQLTGKQIVERGIIANYSEEGVQQQGLDVRVKDIRCFDNEKGFIPAKGKTIIPQTFEFDSEENGWDLTPGYYELEFEEACNIPSNCVLYYKTRSSLVRCGAIVHSGQFDGGFHTTNMGAFLEVLRPIRIEKGARLAQAVVTESYEVDNDHLYNGQWQNDNQRK